MAADEVYIKRGCLVLEDFLSYFVDPFSCIAKQVRLRTSSDSCLVLSSLIRTVKYHVPIMISQYC